MQTHLTLTDSDDQTGLVTQLDCPIRHAVALTSLAARRLSRGDSITRGDLETGLLLADRRCRISPKPEPIDLVLRAEFLRRLGHPDAASADLEAALAIDPDDPLTNRKLMAFGNHSLQKNAALQILECEQEPAILMAALRMMSGHGIAAVARARIVDGDIHGWIAWHGGDQIELHVEDGDQPHTIRVTAEANHQFAAALGRGASFTIKGARSNIGQWFGANKSIEQFHLRRGFSGFLPSRPKSAPGGAPSPVRSNAYDVTVVVPVYGDLEATRACLESLLTSIERETLRVRVLVVNDASPEPGMSEYLANLNVDLITNPANLGFVGAVNSALTAIDSGDVVLLNADTIVPLGAIGRLAAVAHSAPDIATVTPLSNNGELTSLPQPFQENVLPDQAMIERIDAAAQKVHGSQTLELPSGIGFCLYLTRACLDVVNGLSQRYERGYGEDVHLCLAAAKSGLRNVCALSVYVGHAGTRSFRSDKRRLVMQNAKRVAASFPSHNAEIDAFVAADPLRPARYRIGRELIQGFAGHVIIAGTGSATQAKARLAALARVRIPTLVIQHGRERALLRAYAPGGAMTAEADFALPDQHEDLTTVCSSLRPDRVEVFDSPAFEALGFRANLQTTVLHVADPWPLANRDKRIGLAAADAWHRLAKAADRIIAPDAEAAAFAAAQWPHLVEKIQHPESLQRQTQRQATHELRPRLGVVLLNETATCRSLVRALADGLPRNTDQFPPVVVLGATADDNRLMRAGGVMVTGDARIDEIALLAAHYKLTHIFAISSAANFGSPAVVAIRAMGLPLAEFSWPAMCSQPAPPNLAIDPHLSGEDVVRQLGQWLTPQTHVVEINR